MAVLRFRKRRSRQRARMTKAPTTNRDPELVEEPDHFTRLPYEIKSQIYEPALCANGRFNHGLAID